MAVSFDNKTKCSFSLDAFGEVSYLGKQNGSAIHEIKNVLDAGTLICHNDVSYSSEDVDLVSHGAAVFLSCFPLNTPILSIRESSSLVFIRQRETLEIMDIENISTETLLCSSSISHVVLSGNVDYEGITNKVPTKSVYACPLEEELASLGMLLSCCSVRVRRFQFCDDNVFVGKMASEFDSNLENDGAGRMAFQIGNRLPVINEMCVSHDRHPFFGRLLSLLPIHKDECDPVFIMSFRTSDRYFSEEYNSIRYASKSRPMRMKASDAFKMDVMTDKDHVLVRTLHQSDHERMLSFMLYLESRGTHIVRSYDVPSTLPFLNSGVNVFFSNGMIEASEDWIKNRYGSEVNVE